MKHPGIRSDIQALRGFAVGAVLVYHAASRALPGGFLGVDVFFVISGFLMGRIITTDIRLGRFSLSGFYLRRARRLLPAAYVTFAACALLAPWLLTSLEYQDFQKQLLGALTFTSNMVLWRQSGYFAQAAELKPLLHTWSLAVEEQYYLLLPAFLIMTPKRLWLLGLVMGTILSILLCFYILTINPTGAFYLLPTRCWELLLGTVGSLIVTNRGRTIAARFFWPAVIALPVLVVFPFSASRPGLDTLFICIATLVIIIARDERGARGPTVGALAWLGDISYPLYLVHWPIFTFIKSIWIAGPPQYILLVGAMLAAPIAWGMVKFIEQPTRSWLEMSTISRQTASFLAPTALLAALTFLIPTNQSQNYVSRRQANRGLSGACDVTGRFEPIPQCVRGSAPKLLLWGDSFAMHNAQALSADPGLSFTQATMSACAPLLDLALIDPASLYTRSWSDACLAFNRSVFSYLERSPSIEVVVLSSAFSGVLEKTGQTTVLADGSIQPPSRELAAKHFSRTIDEVHRLGKRVVIVAPFPSAQFDVSVCAERSDRGLLTLGVNNDCLIDGAASREGHAQILELLNNIQNETNTPVLDLESKLCGAQSCVIRIDDVVLYRDRSHLSAEGSALLGKKLALPDLVTRLAR
jgi:peptidoglycan/LPS O-acetylase OafA/YrhL